MDTTPIVERLSVIADSVNALEQRRRLTYAEFLAADVYRAVERYFQLAIQAAIGNVLVHMYLQGDPAKVYHSLQHDLPDFDRFVEYVRLYVSGADRGGVT